jgi:crotonobetainyl-CoA:carnitine CoA-transferase CaiB-like acyl-CoA transferase
MALLEGLRVVEVALLAPNMLGMHLADLGADVVKVEEPGRGDYTRGVGGARLGGVSMLHVRWNRGKRSIGIDLRRPEGAAVFRDLATSSDVVIEGLRAGALERRGLGYEALAVVNPAIVFASLSGFGQTGPYRDLATHGVAYDAYAGLAPPERTEDGFPAIPRRYYDIGTQAGALYATTAVLAAVLRARATGRGAWLDVAQADAAVAWNGGRIDQLLAGAEIPHEPGGMAAAVRYQYYDTADGRTILFQASERHFFERFCNAVGRSDLLTPGGGAEFGEHARGDVDLRRELAGIFVTHTQAEWVGFFLEHDVPGGPVHRPADLLDDPQFQVRFAPPEGSAGGEPRLLGTPVHTGEPRPPIRPAPTLGEHTDEVLRDLLDYDDGRIVELRAEGVVA